MSATKELKVKIGLGRSNLLGVAFIVLKLTHVIAWSWIWVLAPFWIPFAVLLVLLMIAGLVASPGRW